jgi:hypothetical protein
VGIGEVYVPALRRLEASYRMGGFARKVTMTEDQLVSESLFQV